MKNLTLAQCMSTNGAGLISVCGLTFISDLGLTETCKTNQNVLLPTMCLIGAKNYVALTMANGCNAQDGHILALRLNEADIEMKRKIA